VRNSDNDSSSTVQTSSTEKKSSFATDKWLAQRDAGKKIEVWHCEQDGASSQDIGQLNTVNTTSNSGSTSQSAGPKWSRSDWQPESSSSDSCLSAETAKQSESHKHRSRSRSPLNSVQAHSSKMSRRSESPSVHARQLDRRREWQSGQHVTSKPSSAESVRTSARQSTSGREESSTHRSSSYDREPPRPSVAGSSSIYQPPLKSALRKPASSSAAVEQKPALAELYSAKYSREQVSSSVQRYQQMNKNAYYLSQIRNDSQ